MSMCSSAQEFGGSGQPPPSRGPRRPELTPVPLAQVHLCWGDEASNTVLELTQPLTGPDANKPVERSKEGYLQLAVGTNDVYKCARPHSLRRARAAARRACPVGREGVRNV